MNTGVHASLAWLPRPPIDFNQRCKALDRADAPGQEVRHLAGHALDENQLARLSRAIARLQQQKLSLAPLLPFRLGLIGNATLELLVPALVASAARHGFALECVVAEYAQVTQPALDPGSTINRARPDAVLIAVDHRGLPLRFLTGDAAAEQADIAAARDFLLTVGRGLRTNAGCICIFQTLAAPPEDLFGSFDRMVPGTPRRVLDGVNRSMADSIAGSEDILFDVAALAATVGLESWHSPAEWNMAKLAFSSAFLPIYADHVGRLLAAMRGKSRRCLILDLDNTLWGGVIGDDGLEGISIAQGDAVGEAHLAVQQLALRLRQRGIVLAVCSKNTDEVARSPFRSHPEMLLREEHFAVFQANWNDKATNIKSIAAELALGLDSMVFLDDNPMERDIVRRMLPQVAVPELPDDPSAYARVLAAAGYFEAVTYSAEDRGRAEMYQSNARRATLQAQAGDLDLYLASLAMQITFAPFDGIGRARISQLINKSNQFNLTTRRYSESEVAAAAADPAVFTLQVRLSDAFGDNGMISVVICRPDPADARTWHIDSWLMSCRVLGRKVEQMVLREILHHAELRGIGRLVGEYIPSDRNGLVRDHYANLGFALLGQGEDGTTRWELGSEVVVQAAPMTVVRGEFEPPASPAPAGGSRA